MASRLTTCKMFRRGKCIALLLISLSVVAWITTFSGENVKLFHVFYPVTLPLVKQDGTESTVIERTAAPEEPHSRAPKAQCPPESPLLSKCTHAGLDRCGTSRTQSHRMLSSSGRFLEWDCLEWCV